MSFRVSVAVSMLLFSSIASSGVPVNREPLGGLYIDTFSGISIKGGLGFLMGKKHEMYEPFLYSDAELGTKAGKISIGMGLLKDLSNFRIGLSYVHDGEESLVGVEGSASLFIYSFKLGVYNSQISNDSYFGVGLGIGF